MSDLLLPQIWVPTYAPTETARLPTQVLEDLVALIRMCACASDGFGFANNQGGMPYVETTQFATSLLTYTAWHGETRPLQRYRDGCIRYMSQLFRPGSGFADAPNGEPLVFATYYGLTCLKMLDALDDRVAKSCKQFLEHNAETAGLPTFVDFPPDTTTCFWGVVAASVIDSPQAVFGDAPLEFIRQCCRDDGSYALGPAPENVGRLQTTVEALLVRQLYSDMPPAREAALTRSYLMRCQTGFGQFGEQPKTSGSPRDLMLGAVALYVLMGSKPPSTNFKIPLQDLWRAHASITAHLASNGSLGLVGGNIRRV